MKFIPKKINDTESVDLFVARGGVIQKVKAKIPKEYKYLVKKEAK